MWYKKNMPTSADIPQPTPEVTQTPRQRVEASFKERQQTANELNTLSNNYRYPAPEGHWDKVHQLEAQLREQNRKFMEEIVSNEPEAKAWVEIEKERLEDTLKGYRSQKLYGVTPTDRAWAEIFMNQAERAYRDAEENLKRVRERNTSAAPTS